MKKQCLLCRVTLKSSQKNSFGTFFVASWIKTDPKFALQEEEGLFVELIGLCTDICVVSNALILKAALPEAKVIGDASCCAGTALEKHRAALGTMKSYQIDIINDDID